MTTIHEFHTKLGRMLADQDRLRGDIEALAKKGDLRTLRQSRAQLSTARDLMRASIRKTKADTDDTSIDMLAQILAKLNDNISRVDFHLL